MNRETFIKHVESTRDSLRRFLVALCCGDTVLADDLAQDTYVKAYLSHEGIRDDNKFRAWIFRIAYTTFINDRRASRTMYDYDELHGVAAEDTADHAFRYEALYRALRRLPAKERSAIALFYLEGYQVKDIAAMYGENENTVRQHLSRGRAHMRDFINSSANN